MSNTFLNTLRAEANGAFDGYDDWDLSEAFYQTTPDLHQYGLDAFRKEIGVEAPKAPEVENDQGFLADAFSYFGEGVGQTIGLAGQGYGLLTGDMDNAATRVSKDVVDYWRAPEQRSSALRQKEADIQSAVDQADGEWAKFGTQLWETLKRPEMIPLELARQASNFLVMGGAGGLTGRMALKGALKKGLADDIALATARKVGAGTAVTTEAAMNGAEVGGAAFDQMLDLKDDLWDQDPEFRALLEQGESRDTAKTHIALNASRLAALKAAGLSAGVGMAPGMQPFEKWLTGLGDIGKGALLARATKAGAKEAFEEGFVEEGMGQVFQNQAVQEVDPNQSTWQGVGQASAQGVLIGGPMGMLAGAMQKRLPAKGDPEAGQESGAGPGAEVLDLAARMDAMEPGWGAETLKRAQGLGISDASMLASMREMVARRAAERQQAEAEAAAQRQSEIQAAARGAELDARQRELSADPSFQFSQPMPPEVTPAEVSNPRQFPFAPTEATLEEALAFEAQALADAKANPKSAKARKRAADAKRLVDLLAEKQTEGQAPVQITPEQAAPEAPFSNNQMAAQLAGLGLGGGNARLDQDGGAGRGDIDAGGPIPGAPAARDGRGNGEGAGAPLAGDAAPASVGDGRGADDPALGRANTVADLKPGAGLSFAQGFGDFLGADEPGQVVNVGRDSVEVRNARGERRWLRFKTLSKNRGAWRVVAEDAAAPAAAAQVEPAPAAESSPALVKMRTVFGDSVHVRQSDLDSDRQRLRAYSANGKPKKGKLGVIHRDNLDPDGKKQQAQNAEGARNGLLDVITGIDGQPFSTRGKASHALRRQGLKDTHEAVEAASVQPGLKGWLVRRKAPADPVAEPASATAPVVEREAPAQAPQAAKAAFVQTHEAGDGSPLMATEEPGVYLDREGVEVEDAGATPLASQQQARRGADEQGERPQAPRGAQVEAHGDTQGDVRGLQTANTDPFAGNKIFTADKSEQKDNEVSAKPDDLGSMFDDVLAEEVAKDQAKATVKESLTTEKPKTEKEAKAALLEELRTKLSAIGERALNAGDGAMAGRISGFTVGMKETDANLTRAWVDEVVSEREKAVAKLEKKAQPKTEKQAKAQRTATDAAASAATNTAAALTNAIDGLGALFGQTPPTNGTINLNSGIPVNINAETYAKAKPLFQADEHDLAALREIHKETVRKIKEQELESRVVDDRLVEKRRRLEQAIIEAEDEINRAKAGRKADSQLKSKEKENENARASESQDVPAGGAGGVAQESRVDDGHRQPLAAGVAEASEGSDQDRRVSGVAGVSDRAGGQGTGQRGGSEPSVAEGGHAGVRDSGGAAQGDAAGRGRGELGEDFAVDAEDIGKGGDGEKFRNNLEAIRLLKQMEAESREATPEERKILARYVGWGGLKGVFDPGNKSWARQHQALKDLLTKDEFDAARASTLDAHYTSPTVVKAMFQALERLGFQSGRVLEPSVGIGNFFGLMPAGMRSRSQLFGVELDSLTSRMVAALYPRARIAKATGFQDYDVPAEFFDAAVGNPPFGNYRITDPERSAYSGFSIHNYFLAKTIDKLRPGGVFAVVVSHNFLDAKDGRARAWIGERANLIGAARLPNDAFKANAGTEVVTDILVFQKHDLSGEVAPDLGFWQEVGEQQNTNPKTGEVASHQVNRLFLDRGDLVLGQPSAAGSMYHANEYTVEPSGKLEKQLKDWQAGLPEKVYRSIDRTTEMSRVDRVIPDGIKVGSYYLDESGRVMQRGRDVAGQKTAEPWEPRFESYAERMKGMIEIRDLMRRQMRLERSPESSERDIEANRKRLNKAYDDFLKKFKHLNSVTNRSVFRDDPEAHLIQGLEFDYDRGVAKGTAQKEGIEPRAPSAKKADILERRVLFPVSESINVATARDALLASLNYKGGIDPAYMSEVYGGKDFDAIVKELGDLVFEDPQAGVVLADEYLSGDVKTKLAEAREAAEKDAAFRRNVQALEKVIPADKLPSEIQVNLGAGYVPAEFYRDFLKHISGGTGEIKYVAATGQWLVSLNGDADAARSRGQFGTAEKSAGELFALAMQGKGVVVTYRDRDGKTIVLEQETEAARAKQAAIQAEWQSWLWQDAERADRLAAIYNEQMNRVVSRSYDGSHLTFPGMSPAITLLAHQKNGVWRGLQDRQVLYDQVVGSGKTFEMATLAMEMRRLGIARKPLFVVPNHLTQQWRSDFLRLYPGANVLAAVPDDFKKERRGRLFAKMISGDWDAVIIGHSSLTKLGLPVETEKGVLKEQLDEISADIKEMKRNRGDKRIQSDMERIKKSLEEKLKAALDKAGKRDNMVTFDELGMDALFVDEMHEFKNLFYNSRMDRTAGMGNPNGSGKASDLFVKIRWLFETFGDKAPLVTATGTPVSNSLVEMFTMQRYMQYPMLKRHGLHVFDAWARMFGLVESVYEVKPSGVGYRQATRFSKFVNLPALMSFYQRFSDTVTLEDLKAQEQAKGKVFPVPNIAGGKPQNIVARRSRLVAEFMGVPRAQVDEDGRVRFMANLDKDVRIEQTHEGKWQLKMDGFSGLFETEEEARLKVVELGITPVVSVHPGSIVGQFDRLRELTRASKGKVNALSLTSLANKAGLDYRIIDPAAPDYPGSKVNLAVGKMMEVYRRWSKDKGAQLVFLDMSVPLSARSSYATKALYAYMRNADGEVVRRKATLHTPEGFEEFPFFVVESGKGETRQFIVHDALSGFLVGGNFKNKTKAVAAVGDLLRIDAKREQWVERQEATGEISEDLIEEYNAENEIEVEEGTSFGRDDIAGMAGAAGFSVYDDIKAKLVAQGVPEREIAFIHDYGTPTAKDKLFKAVNRGEIRFLLGSTPKMGAGTNVQQRLVGLHHIDAPWRPSDLEQREGRIIRRGNQLYERDPEGFEVFIGRYATEQTYDTRRWQILEHKARGIEQLRKYDGSFNEIEDFEGEAANSADMKAAASGDPLILEETRLRNEVKRLDNLRKAHADNAMVMRRSARSARDFAEEVGPRWLEQLRERQATAAKHPLDKDKNAQVKVGGKSRAERDGQIKALGKAHERLANGLSRREAIQYRGLDFVLEHDARLGDIAFVLPDGTRDYLSGSFSPSGMIQRLRNYVERLPARMAQVEADIERSRGESARLAEQAEKPFEQAEELERLRGEHGRVQRVLMARGPDVPAEQKSAVDAAVEQQKARLREMGYGEALDELGQFAMQDGATYLAGDELAERAQAVRQRLERFLGKGALRRLERAGLLKIVGRSDELPAVAGRFSEDELDLKHGQDDADIVGRVYAGNSRQRAAGGEPKGGRVDVQGRVDPTERAGTDADLQGSEQDADSLTFWRLFRVASPWFKRWFGASKVVDENGTPRKVYRGDPAGLEFFNFNRLGENTNRSPAQLGFFFTANKEHAEAYGESVEAFYLSIEKPYKLSQEEFRRIQGKSREWVRDFRAKLLSEGYDGIYFPADVDPENDQFIILKEPQQAKAENTVTGAFSEDRRFRYSRDRRAIGGFYDGQTAHIVAENTTPEQAVGRLIHELGEHASLKEMLGSEKYAEVVAAFDALADKGDPMARAALERVPEGTPEAHRDSEKLAYFGEVMADAEERKLSRSGPARRLWQRIKTLVRQWLDKIPGVRQLRIQHAVSSASERMSARQIADLLRVAVDYAVQKSADPERAAVKDSLRAGEGARASRTEATRVAYERRIDELFAGAEPDNQHGVLVLDKSDVLDLVGLGGYEVLLAEGHAVSEGRFNHPQFTAEDWKSVPEWIENPVAVFERGDGGLTVLAPTIKSGAPIIIGIRPGKIAPDGKTQYHLLLTAYNKDGGRMPIQRMLDAGELRFIDLRKTPAFNRDSGHRLPSNHGELRGLKGSIYTGRDLFKYRQERGDLGQFSLASPDALQDIESRLDETREGVFEQLKAWWQDKSLKEKWQGTLRGRLGLLTLRQLAELADKDLPQIARLVRGMQRMQTERNKMADSAKQIADRWLNLGQKSADRVGAMMHAATTAGVDPAEEYRPIADIEKLKKKIDHLRVVMRTNPGQKGRLYAEWKAELKDLQIQIKQERAREAAHPELLRQWQALSAEEQAIYKDVRDSYITMSKRTEAAIIAKIQQAELDKNYKAQAIARVRQEFEAARVEGPYFPLQRFGEYTVVARRQIGEKLDKKTGEVSPQYESGFFMYDSISARRRDLASLKAEGWEITKLDKRKNAGKQMEDVSAGFVTNVIEEIRKQAGQSPIAELTADIVFQEFLKAAPFMSHRVHFIHRKKTPGWTRDALRAYAFNMAHQASQVARLEAEPDMSKALRDMDAYIEGTAREALEAGDDESADVTRLRDLAEEAKSRFDWLMNPQGSKYAAWATTAGFLWYLGATPAAALVNLSQTPIIAFPVLAARFGATRAAAELLKASKSVFGARLKWKDRGDYSKWEGLSEEERAAFGHWHASGVIDNTQAQMLLGMSETDSNQYNPNVARALELAGMAFHEAEIVNREATLLAAYRLARQAGQSVEQAREAAQKAAWDSHYDYSNANRARYMQGNMAKVFLLFRSYAFHTAWLLGRNAQQAWAGESKEVRAEARKILAGVLGMTGLFAGAMGMPLSWLVFWILDGLFDDDDDPWDSKTAFRDWLADYGVLGQIADRGLINYLTGQNWSSRVSLNELFIRSPDRDLDGKGLYMHYLEQAAGPVFGIGALQFRAADLWSEGHHWRAVETALPKAIKDGLKALRYSREGVNNLKGDPVVSEEQLTPFDIAWQAIGFSPDKVAAQYDANNQAKTYEQRISDRRTRLMGAWAMAHMLGDTEARSEAMEKIRRFNQHNPTVRIDMAALRRSLNTRQRYRNQADAGIHLQPKLRHLRDETRVAM